MLPTSVCGVVLCFNRVYSLRNRALCVGWLHASYTGGLESVVVCDGCNVSPSQTRALLDDDVGLVLVCQAHLWERLRGGGVSSRWLRRPGGRGEYTSTRGNYVQVYNENSQKCTYMYISRYLYLPSQAMESLY